jgi:hypothetical protein
VTPPRRTRRRATGGNPVERDHSVAGSRRRSVPPTGAAEVRVIAAAPDVVDRISAALDDVFTLLDRPRRYPADDDGQGVRVYLTVDTRGEISDDQ